MKKLLGIVVLGLLWCNISIADSAVAYAVARNYTEVFFAYSPDGLEAARQDVMNKCYNKYRDKGGCRWITEEEANKFKELSDVAKNKPKKQEPENNQNITILKKCTYDSSVYASVPHAHADAFIDFDKKKISIINYAKFGKTYKDGSNQREDILIIDTIKGDIIKTQTKYHNAIGNYYFEIRLNTKSIHNITDKGPQYGIYCQDKETLIAEKPKEKKKPKSTPDDDKIVPAGSGSGFFVSKDGHAITNYHVIEGCDINKLSFKGSQTEVQVLAVDKVNDIAILKSSAKPDVIFPVSNEDVSLLEDVIVAGFPLGKQISSAIKTHKGVVTALAGAGDNYSFFQTDAAINQGNSGGPIINQKGNVVGIAVATWVEEGVQGVHFGIKSSTLKTFASANGLSFASPNYRELSNKDLGKLITKGTIYVECHMTIAKIKKMIAQAENRKAFFKEHR